MTPSKAFWMYLFVSSLNGLSLTFQVEDVEAVLIISLVPPAVLLIVGIHLVVLALHVLCIQVVGIHLLQYREVFVFPC